MTIRLRSLTLRDSPNSDSVSSPESQSQSLSFPLSHDFNAIKSSCWLVGTLEGSLPFPFVSFALVGGAACLLCKTNKMEGGGAAAATATTTIDLRERIRYRVDGSQWFHDSGDVSRRHPHPPCRVRKWVG